MTFMEILSAVIIGTAVGIPVGYIQFRISSFRKYKKERDKAWEEHCSRPSKAPPPPKPRPMKLVWKWY